MAIKNYIVIDSSNDEIQPDCKIKKKIKNNNI